VLHNIKNYTTFFLLKSHDTQQVSTRYHGRKQPNDEPDENTIAHQLYTPGKALSKYTRKKNHTFLMTYDKVLHLLLCVG
jgi:hypothetical protein